ncbi:MAG TPA: HAD family phosphatase [Burkholderiaceae bacterium]|nr:HAD family phosphatase [Burkholderiaceae bacterium]
MPTQCAAKPCAYLFDMDGTLVDNMGYHTEAWIEFFRRHGRQIDPQAFFIDTAGRQGREIIRDYCGPELDDAACGALLDEKERVYREMYGPHRRVLPGLREFIGEARRRDIVLAVGTSAPDENIAFTLDGLALRDCFQVVVGAADVTRGKPAPDVFLTAAQRCGVAPADCIVFEDAPLGVEAARHAGMRAVVLTTTMPAEAFAGFDNVIAFGRDFDELGRGYFASRAC